MLSSPKINCHYATMRCSLEWSNSAASVPSRAVEGLLPRALSFLAVAHERRPCGERDQQAIEEVGRKAQRLDEIQEQHDADLVAVVPRLVLVGVVEHQDLALAPVARPAADADAGLLAIARHDQAEMKAQHAIVGTAM